MNAKQRRNVRRYAETNRYRIVKRKGVEVTIVGVRLNNTIRVWVRKSKLNRYFSDVSFNSLKGCK